jgi:hypothetical protein
MKNLWLALLLWGFTQGVVAQKIDTELATYLQQLGVKTPEQYEGVLICLPHHSFMSDDFWVRHFIEVTTNSYSRILMVLVIEDPKQLNDLVPKALKRPNVVLDQQYLFHQQRFYSYCSLFFDLENGLVKQTSVLNTQWAYRVWTRIATKHIGTGKRRMEMGGR